MFGTALRRVQKFANENKDDKLIINERMLKIHWAIFGIWALATMILAATFMIYFVGWDAFKDEKNPRGTSFRVYSIMQLTGFIIEAIAYSTVYYLFWIFASPIKLDDMGPSQDETPGGPGSVSCDVLDNLQGHLQDTKKKHRRGTMSAHERELEQHFNY